MKEKKREIAVWDGLGVTDFEDGEKTLKESEWPLKALHGDETDSPLELPEKQCSPADTLILAK